MKTRQTNRINIELILGIVLIMSFIVMLKATTREFPLQYIEDGEMKTEIFHSPKEFSERAAELKAKGVKYYLSY